MAGKANCDRDLVSGSCGCPYPQHTSPDANVGDVGSNDNDTPRPYRCTICYRNFKRKYHLMMHSRSHSGERPFLCSFCSKDFRRKDHLVIHQRRHTGEKPYSCPGCGKRFIQANGLRYHIKYSCRQH